MKTKFNSKKKDIKGVILLTNKTGDTPFTQIQRYAYEKTAAV